MPKGSDGSYVGPDPLFTSFAVPHIGGMAQVWHDVLSTGIKMRCPKGGIVAAEGEGLFDLFYLEQGTVEVVFGTLDGRGRSVISFEPGSLFNLAPAATRREASGQYVCVTDAVVWRIPGSVLHDPAFAAAHPQLMLAVIQLLGTLVLTYHTSLTDMLMEEFIIRFSRFLLSLSLERQSVDFSPGLTQEKLATMLGVHRATLARAIQRLKREGIISCFTRGRLHIIDMDRLRAMAKG